MESTVASSKTLSRFRVHIFLAGLDQEFNQARSEILRKDPPLDLESSYAYIRKDHSQRQSMEEPKPEPDSMVHLASRNRTQNTKGRNNKGNTLNCTHCGEDGHSKTKCYELIGYPEWWDFTKKPKKKIGQAATVKSSQTVEMTTPIAAHTSTNTGMSISNQKNQNNRCIIDTGATDHMTNDPAKLIRYHTPKQANVKTANGEMAHVVGEGTVKVTNSMDLDCVLVVPSLSSNLLSVSQITEALNCYVIFWKK